MKNFSFIRPNNLAEALTLLAERKSSLCILNGGTDVMVNLNSGSKGPMDLLYVHDLPELKTLELKDGELYIGGAVTYSQLEESPLTVEFACLGQAMKQLASPPIRRMGTPAGNIATASPAGDFNLIMLALDAKVEMRSLRGSRILPITEVYQKPYHPNMNEDELIMSIRIPVPAEKRYSAFCKLGRRKGQDISRVAVAVSYAMENGKIKGPRIAVGAVNPIPFRSFVFEDIVSGKTPEEAVDALKGQFPPESTPRRAYKKEIVSPMIQRAIREAFWQKGD